MKKQLDQYLKKIKSFTQNSEVSQYSQWAADTVESLSKFVPIKQIPALAAAASAVEIANNIINPQITEGSCPYLSRQLRQMGFSDDIGQPLAEFFRTHPIFDTPTETRYLDDFFYKIAECGNGAIAILWGRHDVLGSVEFYRKGLSNSDIAEVFWAKMGAAASLSADRMGKYQKDVIRIEAAKLDGPSYLSAKHSPAKMAAEVRELHAAGSSVAYCLTGPPGSGKTSFCYRVAELLGGRTIILSSTVLANPSVFVDLTKMIAIVSPSVIIIDDIDNSGSEQSMLEMISAIRKGNPLTVLLSTTNHWDQLPKGLKRPGRLGQRIDFLAPSNEERLSVISTYSSVFGVSRDLAWCSELMDHPLFTHDYVIDVVEKAAILDDEALRAHIMSTLDYLKEIE